MARDIAPPPAGPQDRPLAGILANATAFAAITCGDALTKLVVMMGSVPQTLTIRGFFLLALLTPLFIRARRRGETVFATRQPGRHLTRAAIQIVSIFTFFVAMQHLAFTTIVSLMLVTPIFAALAGIVLVGERVRLNQIGAIGMGLVGSLVIIDPRGADFSWWTLVALASSATWGIAQTYVRLLARTESHITILAWSNASFLVVMGAVSVFDWRPVEPLQLLAILAMATTQLFGQWFTTLAFRLAPVATVAPAQYTQMLWAILLGLAIWGEWPAPHVWAGVALVISGGIWLVGVESRRRPS